MKEAVPAWSAVVVLFHGPRNVLAITRAFNPRDIALPGGDSVPEDESPAKTAARELFEETGLLASELRCMAQWTGERGQPVFAFFVPKWRGRRLRASSEGKPFWTTPERLVRSENAYATEARDLLEKLGRIRPALSPAHVEKG